MQKKPSAKRKKQLNEKIGILCNAYTENYFHLKMRWNFEKLLFFNWWHPKSGWQKNNIRNQVVHISCVIPNQDDKQMSSRTRLLNISLHQANLAWLLINPFLSETSFLCIICTTGPKVEVLLTLRGSKPAAFSPRDCTKSNINHRSK